MDNDIQGILKKIDIIWGVQGDSEKMDIILGSNHLTNSHLNNIKF